MSIRPHAADARGARGVAAREREDAAPARHHRHVLHAVDLVGDRRGDHPRAGRRFPELRAVARAGTRGNARRQCPGTRGFPPVASVPPFPRQPVLRAPHLALRDGIPREQMPRHQLGRHLLEDRRIGEGVPGRRVVLPLRVEAEEERHLLRGGCTRACCPDGTTSDASCVRRRATGGSPSSPCGSRGRAPRSAARARRGPAPSSPPRRARRRGTRRWPGRARRRSRSSAPASAPCAARRARRDPRGSCAASTCSPSCRRASSGSARSARRSSGARRGSSTRTGCRRLPGCARSGSTGTRCPSRCRAGRGPGRRRTSPRRVPPPPIFHHSPLQVVAAISRCLLSKGSAGSPGTV